MNLKETTGKRRQLTSSGKDDDSAVELQPLVLQSNTITKDTLDGHHLTDVSDHHKKQSNSFRSYSLTPIKTRFTSLFVSDRDLSPKDHSREQQEHCDITTNESSRLKQLLPINTILKNPKGLIFSFRSKDRRDATGKKGYRVDIPTRLIMYISIIFLFVPLFVGFILLMRTLIGMHIRTEVSVEVISHSNVTLSLGNTTNLIKDLNPTVDFMTNASTVGNKNSSLEDEISENLDTYTQR